MSIPDGVETELEDLKSVLEDEFASLHRRLHAANDEVTNLKRQLASAKAENAAFPLAPASAMTKIAEEVFMRLRRAGGQTADGPEMCDATNCNKVATCNLSGLNPLCEDHAPF